eukprot:s1304_g8.t1
MARFLVRQASKQGESKAASKKKKKKEQAEKRKDKKRKKSSSSSSEKSESSSFQVTPARGGELWRTAQKKPGQLTKLALDEMSRYLADRSDEIDGDQRWRGQRISAYLNQVLLSAHPPQKIGLRMLRELQTVSITLDHLLAGRLAEATDTLIQRLKACEMSLAEGSWSMARHLEIIPPAAASLVQAEERELASKQELRSMKLRDAAPKHPKREISLSSESIPSVFQRSPDSPGSGRGGSPKVGPEGGRGPKGRATGDSQQASGGGQPERTASRVLAEERPGKRKGSPQEGSPKRRRSKSPQRASRAEGGAYVESRKVQELMEWFRDNSGEHLTAAQMAQYHLLQAVNLNGSFGRLIESSLKPIWEQGSRVRNLMPLPLWPDVMQAMSDVIDAQRYRDQPGEWRNRGNTKTQASRALRTQGVLLWHGLVVVGLNWMHCGGNIGDGVGVPAAHASQQQESALCRIWELVKVFVDEKPKKGGVPRTPQGGWEGELEALRVSYTGEVVQKARPLTLEQVLPGLPSPDHGGLVDILEVVDEKLKKKLERPDLLLKDVFEQLPTPQVMCADDEWERVVEALYARHLVRPVSRKPVVGGVPVLNGAFGVPKEEWPASATTHRGPPGLKLHHAAVGRRRAHAERGC